MSWKLLSTDEKLLVSSLLVVVASFGLTFSTEINSKFQATGQLIEPCGDSFCSADEYSSQSCPVDCPALQEPVCGNALCEAAEDATSCPSDCPVAPPLPPGYCGDTICESWEQGICLADCSYSPPPTST